MKNIYLIFIVTCLVEQLKADVYAVRVNDIHYVNRYLARVTRSGGSLKDLYIHKHIEQGDISAETAFFDRVDGTEEYSILEDLCNMDTSTSDGTIAAILWGIFGVKSCPVEEDTYPIIKEFKITGILGEMFGVVDNIINVMATFDSSDGETYFQVDVNVSLVEKDEGEGS